MTEFALAAREEQRATVLGFSPCARDVVAATNVFRMASTEFDVVIWGVTRSGRRFRPSDWAERLAGLVSAFGDDRKLAYSPLVLPMTLQGVKTVIIGAGLESLEPRLYRFLTGFARDNDLQTSRVEGALASPQSLIPPVTGTAREPQEPV